ncbi:MAG: hypothetical protein ACRDGE_04390, partial [Candidatus Limnocylindria bacterium]
TRRRTLEGRLARLRELYEMGDLARPEYRARRDKLEAELAQLRDTDAAPFRRASETIGSLVDDWDAMDAGQKRRVLESIFQDVVLDEGQLVSATPRAGWLDYLEAILESPQGGRRRGVFDVRRRRESNPR